MRKPIFESEEQFIKFLDCVKRSGYIRRSPVDEAEEMYNEKFQEHRQTFLEVKQNEAIQYQKEIIKELEKQLEEK